MMKIKIILFIVCSSLLALLQAQAQAQKVAVFEEFGQPESISFGNGFIYVQEKTTIFVYNPKDYKFITKFGKEGEGPGEIKKNPFGGPMAVTPYNNKVYISNFGKLSIFSKTGEFITEYKINPFDNFLSSMLSMKMEKKRIYLPVPENYRFDAAFHVNISDNWFYKLEENIDEETWELYRIKI